MYYSFKEKLHLCIMIFTLITNLTPDFRKYSAIPSHLKNVCPNTLTTWKPENALNVFIPVLLEWVIHVSKEGEFDLQIETVHYLVEFRLYDLRQTVQIFTAVAFRLCKSSLQLHLGVFQSFHFGYKEVRVSVRIFFQMWRYRTVFPKIRGQTCN